METQYVLQMLAKEFPHRYAVRGEIVRLRALMAMPKGTEYFFSDIHGEDRAFLHLLRSASGNIRRKIRDVYRSRLSEQRQNELASIIYDPQLAMQKWPGYFEDAAWIENTILELVEVARFISSKYPRETIREKMPSRYANVLEELFYTNDGEIDRHAYYHTIVAFLSEERAAKDFLMELCFLIQRICVNHLHIVGDIFDRGPGPHIIMEELISFDQVDIQWGNHDILWMGAAIGNTACMMAVLRNALRYNAFDVLEDGYAIHLRSLNDFAQEVYGDDPCERFQIKRFDENIYDVVDPQTAARMHKAIAVLEFKLEGQLLQRHPEYELSDRIVLNKVDFARGIYKDGEQEYPMLDRNFPTIDPEDPLRLSAREEELLRGIRASFLHSETLQRHAQFLFQKGSSYLRYNGNLLFHGCVPMRKDGEFASVHWEGQALKGKALFDHIDYMVTQAYHAPQGSKLRNDAIDFLWYLWCGPKSPMFGKSKMSTFENYFIADKRVRLETPNPYYPLSMEEQTCIKVLEEFGLNSPTSHIINGHVPVKAKDGQSPMRGNGRLFLIDGGIAKAYQKTTGIAGYTLIFNSHHIALAEHVDSLALENELETYSPRVQTVFRMGHRVLIEETDRGKEYKIRLQFLHQLLNAYIHGDIKEEQF